MKAMTAIVVALTLAGPAGLTSQQRAHGKPAAARLAPARDTLSGTIVAIDTMRAEGMMPGMKAAMPGMQHDSGAMKHDMAGMKHDTAGMKHDMAGMKHEMPGMGGMSHAECHKMMTEGGGGLALRIQVGQDTLAAHLGPIWYLKQQSPDGFAIGDRLTVDGAAMKGEMPPHWMAYTVTRGGLRIALRDERGKPRWAGAMMKGTTGMKGTKPPL